MKRTSKYLNKEFDNGWVCTYVGTAYVCPKRYRFQQGKTKRPGSQTYYYVFERRTLDGKADKIVRLSSRQAADVYSGKLLVESIADAKAAKASRSYVGKVSYSFDKKEEE